MAIQKAEQLLL